MTLGSMGDLNWLAVILATVAYFALGALWFMPAIFGKAWMRSIGWEPDPGQRPGAEYYVGPFVTCLIASIATGLLVAATATDTVAEGMVLGLVTGVGLVGSALFVTGYFDPKKPQPMTWFAISGGYHLAGLIVASVILSVWG
jgi:hypothetical protein